MHVPGTLALGSYGAVSEGCPMNYSITDCGAVDFMVGDASSNYFEFGFDAAALRQFVKLGIRALREIDARAIENDLLEDGVLVAAREQTA